MEVVVGRLGGTEVDVSYYAIRLVHQPFGPDTPPNEIFWLHRDLTMKCVLTNYQSKHAAQEWRWDV